MTAAFTFAIAACNENSEISPENAEPVKDNRLAMNTAFKRELTDDAQCTLKLCWTGYQKIMILITMEIETKRRAEKHALLMNWISL